MLVTRLQISIQFVLFHSMSKRNFSVLFSALLFCASVLGQDSDWSNWNPSPPLGPRPQQPPPPYTQPDPRLLQYQQQLGQWCTGCIIRCLMWRDKDFGECSSAAECACPPGLKAQPSPYFQIDESTTCPLGYAPVETLHGATTFSQRRTGKKNVVLFLMDDLDERVTPYWQAMPFTKSLFNEQGARFTNAFSSTSVCCAARCQILTGLYGHNVGVLANSGMYGGLEGFKMPHDQKGQRMKDSQGRCINNENRILPLLLQQAGYKTAVWGKYINGFENDTTNALNYPVPPGWDHFVIPSSRGYYTGYNYMLTEWDSSRAPTNISYEYRGVNDTDYLTDVIRDKSIAWIDSQRQNGEKPPLFMYLNPSCPHFPITAARRHKASSSMWNDLYNTTVPTRPDFDADVSHKPFYLRDNAALRQSWIQTPWTRLDFVKRMGSLMAADEMIQAVYQKFVDLGELSNTVFIFTSDNGYNHGAFGLSHKMVPYEDSIRVPLYFSQGGVVKQVIQEQALLIDLAPTILDFANLQAPSSLDGKSWWRYLIDTPYAAARRNMILLQYKKFTPGEDPNAIASEAVPALFAVVPPALALDIPPYRAIRTDRYMLAEWVNGYANGTYTLEYEAYDLLNDPNQLTNIYSTMSSSLKQSLISSMNTLNSCSGVNCWQAPVTNRRLQ